jgi:two-component system, NarL family, sensor kinase
MRKLLLAIFVFINFTTYGQSKTIDSLETVLKNPNLVGIPRATTLYDFTFRIADQKDTTKVINLAKELLVISEKNNYQDGFLNYYKILGKMKVARGKYQEGVMLLEKQRDLAIRYNKESSLMDAYTTIGRAYGYLEKNTDAIQATEKALLLAQKLQTSNNLAVINNNLSSIYLKVGRQEDAIRCVIESIKYAEKVGDNAILGAAYNNIGRLLNESKRYDESMEYSRKAIALSEKTKNDRNLGIANINLANSYVEKGQLSEATPFIKKSLVIFEKIGFGKGVAICMNNLGSIALRQGKYEEAIEYYQKIITSAEKTKDMTSMGLYLQNIGTALSRSKQYEKALPYFEKAEAQKNLLLSEKIEIYKHRVELDSAVGNYKSAFLYQAKQRVLEDSIINVKKNNQISELKTKYETEKKEQQISILNTQNQLKGVELEKSNLALNNKNLLVKQQSFALETQLLTLRNQDLAISNQQLEISEKDIKVRASELENEKKQAQIKTLDTENQLNRLQVERKNIFLGILAGAFLLASLLGYLFYNRRKLQQEAKLQTEVAKQQELATQAVLDAEERERTRIAADLHDGVGQTIMALKMNLAGINDYIEFKNPKAKNVFEKALDLATESAKEVRSISHQMMPNALIKSGLASAIREFISKVEAPNLKINLNVSNLNESIEPNIEKVLYRVIQESVNNVIKHAQASQLNIQLSKNKNSIEATIEDNGVGFDLKGTDYEGIGLKNIRDRVAFLKGNVDISSQKGKGTLLAIQIPMGS